MLTQRPILGFLYAAKGRQLDLAAYQLRAYAASTRSAARRGKVQRLLDITPGKSSIRLRHMLAKTFRLLTRHTWPANRPRQQNARRQQSGKSSGSYLQIRQKTLWISVAIVNLPPITGHFLASDSITGKHAEEQGKDAQVPIRLMNRRPGDPRTASL